jgi:DEAD/DEAH box helicase domain-containing protein
MAVTAGTPLESLLTLLAADGRLVHLERLAPRPARYAELSRRVPSALVERLPTGGLWSHQATAVDLARDGRSVAIATGTASGKSLCYQLPVAEACGDAVHPGTALLLFPTKALAHDQLRALAELDLPGLVPAAYDGDCSPEERTWVRRNANAVLTNPEMLHCALLPHHGRWATFLMRLRYVVVDELHVFRGIFGSHVAHLLRRLRRLAAHYGASPTFVFCSATIGEPAALATALCGLPVAQVVDDGSPRGERLVALWNPPLLDEVAGIRASANGETASLVADLVAAGHRTIAFCRSRRATEVVAADVRRRLPDHRAAAVRAYRGGYLASERREIEAELFTGRLDGVIATTALELGVDIGGLDACVLDGFPGTVASMWQQAGRAGREQQQSLAVLVAGQDQLDQWFMANPEQLFTRPPEPAVVNPSNPYVLHPHLACAAYELPLTHGDERYWPEVLDDGVRALVRDDRLKVRPSTHRTRSPAAVWAARGFPAHGVGLRSGPSSEFRIARDDGELVGTVDEGRAFEMVHPGAIYLHQGVAYRVRELDLDDRVAYVDPHDGSEYTMARTEVSVRVAALDRRASVGRLGLHLGTVEVSSQVTGYQRRAASSGDVLGTEALDLPATRLVTRSFWYVIEPALLARARVPVAAWPGTLHAVEHAAIGMLPLFAICDRWDVGGVSTVHAPDAGAPAFFVYDGYAGGAGVAELGFAAGDRHLEATADVIAACPCQAGCPSCVQSPKCGNWNEPLDKHGALALLQLVLDRPR